MENIGIETRSTLWKNTVQKYLTVISTLCELLLNA